MATRDSRFARPALLLSLSLLCGLAVTCSRRPGGDRGGPLEAARHPPSQAGRRRARARIGPRPRAEGRRRPVRRPRASTPGRRPRGASRGWKVEGRRPGDRPGGRADPDEGDSSGTFSSTSSGPRPTRPRAWARIAATAGSSSWASSRCRSSTPTGPTPTPTARPGRSTASIPRCSTPRARPASGRRYDIAFRRPRFDRDGKLLDAGPPDRLPQRHPRPEQRGTLGPDELARVAALRPPGRPRPDPAPGPQSPRPLPQHLAPQAARSPRPLRRQLKRPAIVSLPADVLDALAGAYSAGPEPNASRFVLDRATRITCSSSSPTGPAPLLVQPISATEFVMPHTDARFTFQKDDQGRVSVVFRVGDGERTLTRTGP